MFSPASVTVRTPHPFTRWKSTTRDQLCAKVLTPFMNSKGDTKVLHGALWTGHDSHGRLGEVGHGRGKCSWCVGHGFSLCWIGAPIAHKLITWPPSSVMDLTYSSGFQDSLLSAALLCNSSNDFFTLSLPQWNPQSRAGSHPSRCRCLAL